MSSVNSGHPVFRAAPQPPKRQSHWLWWVYLGIGTISWIGFVVVAAKVRNRKFVTAAVISAVLCGVGYAAYVLWPPADDVLRKSDPDANADLSSYNGLLVQAAFWILLIVYGHILNHDYKKLLRAKDDEDRRRLNLLRTQAPAFYPQPASPTTAGHAPPPPTASESSMRSAQPADSVRVEADQYFATQPAGNAPAAVPPNAPEA